MTWLGKNFSGRVLRLLLAVSISAGAGVARTAASDDSAIRLNYRAKAVYLVVGGTGTVTVRHDGTETTVPVSGPPSARQIVADSAVRRGELEVRLSKGVQAFSFTYG